MIKVSDLSLSLSGRSILKDINFSIEENSSLIISGANGSGKTKLLEILAGFENSYSGKVTINGSYLETYGSELYDILGYLSSFGTLNNFSENIISSLVFPLELQNVSKEKIKRKLDIIIKDFCLLDLIDTKPNNLSAGELQLINLCSIIIKKPKILILDNPMTIIDSAKKNNFFDKIIRSKTSTVIMASNDVRTFLDFDNILFLIDGEKYYFGDTSTFLKDCEDILKVSGITI